MRHHQLMSFLAGSILLSLSACVDVNRPPPDDPWRQEILHRWDRLTVQKQILKQLGQTPKSIVFEGRGTMDISDWSLDGGPGWEYVRADYIWSNTTKESLDRMWVWLEVMDPAGKVVSRQREIIWHPWGAFRPGWSYSDVIRTPTRGANLLDGWSWRVGCAPVRTEEFFVEKNYLQEARPATPLEGPRYGSYAYSSNSNWR